MSVVMDDTMAPMIFKPERTLFFQDEIVGAIDTYPGKLEWLTLNNLVYLRAIVAGVWL